MKRFFAYVLCMAIVLLAQDVYAQFIVDDTGDAIDANPGDGICATGGGVCTLRAAIEEANALAGADDIVFDAGLNGATITLSGAATITTGNGDGTTINGDIDGDFLPDVTIESNGSSINGIVVQAANCELSYLHVQGFDQAGRAAILIENATATDNSLIGNFIGTDNTGNAAGTTNHSGIYINSGAIGTLIGDGTANGKNIIGGNSFGIRIAGASTSSIISGNNIGVGLDGTTSIDNSRGIDVASTDDTQIGFIGDLPNVISTNGGPGIYLSIADNTIILNNLVGVDESGNVDLGNDDAIWLRNGSDGTQIGNGTAAGTNILSAGSNTGHGVWIDDSDNTTILGNYIGLGLDGSTQLPNNNGVLVDGTSANTTIGDGTSGGRNVISANSIGISVTSGPTYIYGNYIGTDDTGTANRGNANAGISLSGGTGEVGGNTAGEGNVTSGNSVGISLSVSGGFTILGNYIGTNATGDAAIPNTTHGINLTGSNNTIGDGTIAGANVISGNNQNGIFIRRASGSIDNNLIHGNYIGVASDGSTPLGNGENGIHLGRTANTNTIQANTISGNTLQGIDVGESGASDVLDNIFTQNSIYDNGGEGILISFSAQNSVPLPVITSTTDGNLVGTSDPGATIEIFADGSDEGEQYLDFTVADGSGNWSHAIDPASINPGLTNISVTQTSASNTSEFASATLDLVSFITTWITTDNQITIPTTGGGYNYDITWTNLTNAGVGDGSITGQTGNYTITGLSNGDTYQVEITGAFPQFSNNNNGTNGPKLLTIEQWGDISWGSFSNAFNGCTNLTYNATDSPDLTLVMNMDGMFRGATSFNGNIGSWDVSGVEDFSFMFYGASTFDQPLDSWVVTSALTMASMFQNATDFNQNLNSWVPSNVITMQSMFQNATSFNGQIDGWDITSLDNAVNLFNGASSFNQTIESWDVTGVTDVRGMFANATVFNQPLNGWGTKTSTIDDMSRMFQNAEDFDQPLNSWDVSSVQNMAFMFAGATSFNQNLDNWTPSSCLSIQQMFEGATNFNGLLDGWGLNTSLITNMQQTFYNATSFNRPLNSWDVSSVQTMDGMFQNADIFDQDLNSWTTSACQNMARMFNGATAFDGAIDAWDLSLVTNISSMFNGASSFDQPIGNWGTSTGLVQSMVAVFFGASSFDQPLDSWDVSSVSNMQSMFRDATSFDQDLSSWNTTSVNAALGMYFMFSGATSFNGDISTWDVSNCPSLQGMFLGASLFNQNLGAWDIGSAASINFGGTSMSTANYDATLIGWLDDNGGTETIPSGFTVNATGIDYCASEADRQTLIDTYGWTMNDGVKACANFVTTWITTDNQITIPTNGGGYNYDVYWENTGNALDNGTLTNQMGDALITGLTNGATYRVEITGTFPSIYFNHSGDKDKIMTVEQWGNNSWTSMYLAFAGCTNLTVTATDLPDLTFVNDFRYMFDGASSFNSPINNWDVSAATQMTAMFQDAVSFNQDLDNWNIGNVFEMTDIFAGATAFNGNVSTWNITGMTSLRRIFQNASNFNQPLNSWNVSGIISFENLFEGASSFNQDLDSWVVSGVSNMNGMFMNATDFNGNIDGWVTTSLTSMQNMFSGATSFNRNIGSWDVDMVFDMRQLFFGATSFNQDISSWNVSSVSLLFNMFNGATSFNQDISGWSVGGPLNFVGMFNNATSFDQNLGSWDISSATSLASMLNNTGMSTANYDATLIGWEAQAPPSGLSLGATGLTYCTGATAHTSLTTTYSWAISDAGVNCSAPNDPSDLYVTEISTTQLDLSWIDNSTDETGFTIERSDGNNTSFATLTTVGADVTTYSDNTVTVNNGYFYRVIANGGSGDSNPSNEKYGSTIALPGHALDFDGVDDVVDFGDVTYMDGLTSITIEGWFNTLVSPEFTATDEHYSIIAKGDMSFAGNNAVGIYFRSTDGGGDIFGRVGTGTGTESANYASSNINAGDWYHVAMSWTANGYVNLYINGVLVASSGSTLAGSINDISESLYFGSSDSGVEQGFGGTMDEVRIWNIERSQAEIRNSMSTSLIGNEAGLIGYYRFDQGIPNGDNTTPPIDLLPDRSTNNINGTLVNFTLNGFTSNWVDSQSMLTYNIASQSPLPNEIGVNPSNDILITFDYDVGNINNAFTVRSQLTGIVSGSLGNNDADLTFTPDAPFLPGDVITVTIGPDFQSLGDVYLGRAITYKFTIAANSGPETPNFFVESPSTIISNSVDAQAVVAIDIDGDGDLDVASAGEADNKIAWFENDGSQNFTEHVISTNAIQATDVFLIDLDSDGDIDVLSSSQGDDKIAWYENDGTQNFAEQLIDGTASQAEAVFAIDMEGDGDVDVLAALPGTGEVVWYENDGSENFTRKIIVNSLNSPRDVHVADINQDGLLDIVTADLFNDEVFWLENDGVQNFTSHTVATASAGYGPWGVYAWDFDQDGDMDIFSSAEFADEVAWYENDGSNSFTFHSMTSAVDGVRSFRVIDIDADGDMDVATASDNDGKIAWFENDGGFSFSEHVVTTNAGGARGVDVADIDNDGDLDLVSGAQTNDEVAWYENASPVASSPPHMYWTENIDTGGGEDEIHRTDLNGNNFSQYYSGFADEISGIEVDEANNRLYWTDASQAEIATGEIGGTGLISGPDKLLDYNPGSASGLFDLALDVANNHIYFTHAKAESGFTNKIARCDLDGSNDVELIDTGLEEPFGIDIDHVNGKIYYITNRISTGTARQLYRADLDGGNVELVYSTGSPDLEHFRDVKIDPINEIVYWTSGEEDVPLGTIFYNDINESAPFVAPSSFTFGGEPWGLDLDLINNKIYWVCRGASDGAVPPAIMQSDLDGSSLINIFNITIFPPGFPPAPPGSSFIALDLRGAVALPPFSLVSATPVSNSIGVNPSADIVLNFNDNVDGTTIAGNILVIGEQTGQISGTFSGGGTATITFDPTNDFKAGERIQVTLSSSIMSTSGSTLEDYFFSFDIASNPSPENPPLLIESSIYDDGTNTGVDRIVAFDIDLDGDQDLAAIYEGIDEGVAWYENDGSETFTRQVAALPVMSTSRSVAAADLDLDGDIDLLSAADGRLNWYINDGAFNFTETFIYQTGVGFGLADMRVVDMDGDGDLDVVGAYSTSVTDFIRWHENDGTGNFTNSAIIVSGINNPQGIEVADIDDDGDVDILVGGSDDDIAWYENDGDQNFTSHLTTPTSMSSQFSGFAIGDFNGDGNLDMALNSTTETSWFANDGAGNFTEQVISASVGGEDIVAADLDGDGDTDLVAGTNTAVRFFENDGSGNFTIRTTSTSTNIEDVFITDLDSDGDLDVVASAQLSKIVWFENTTTSPSEPEISVYVGIDTSGAQITDGQATAVDIGSSALGTDIAFDFTIWNNGTGDLNVSDISFNNSTGSFDVNNGITTIAPGVFETFTVLLTGGNAGTFTADVVITNDDADESMFTFPITGTIIAPGAPEIVVYLGNDDSSNEITSGQTQVVDIGSSSLGTDLLQVFTIKNDGDADLTINGIGYTTSDPGYDLSSNIGVIPSGTLQNFTVVLSGAESGVFTASLAISSDDADEDPFTFQVQGAITGVVIIDGEDNTGDVILSSQNVDMGSTLVNVDIERTFVIENLSTTDILTVDSITVDNPIFEVLEFSPTVPPMGFIQFTIQLNARDIGVYTTNVMVFTSINDFNFVLTGEVTTIDAPDLNVYNILTPNGDGVHDFFKIGNIGFYTDNEVTIYNRWGDKVFQLKGYDNVDNIFVGDSNVGGGKELDTGNYYYAIDKGDGSKSETGFLFLKR